MTMQVKALDCVFNSVFPAEIDFWQQACQQGCEVRSASALLECVVSGRFAELVSLVQRVEIEDLLVCLPMLLRFMVASPFWIQNHVSQIQESLKSRAEAQSDLRQLAIFLRQAEWVPSTILDKIAGTNRARSEVGSTNNSHSIDIGS